MNLSDCWHTRNRDEDQWQYSHWWPKFNFKYVVPVTSSLLTVQSVKWICRICRGTSVSLSRHGYRRWINWLVLLNWKVFNVHYEFAWRKIQKNMIILLQYKYFYSKEEYRYMVIKSHNQRYSISLPLSPYSNRIAYARIHSATLILSDCWYGHPRSCKYYNKIPIAIKIGWGNILWIP